MHAEAASLVGGRSHDTAIAGPADDHRQSGQFGTAPHLHRREEGIHVHVQHGRFPERCHGHTLGRTADRPGAAMFAGVLA